MKKIEISRLRVIALGTVLFLVAVFTRPAQALPRSAPSHTATQPCALPAPLAGTMIDPAGLGEPPVSVDVPDNPADLVITCLQLDQTHYQEGNSWSATLVVRNLGSSISDDFSISTSLCRYEETGTYFQCQATSSIASNESPLAPGESRLISSAPATFSQVPHDSNPAYDSWATGVPNNSFVYLKARANWVGGSSEAVLAQAVYPTAPNDEACLLDSTGPFCILDGDGDGWYTDGYEPVLDGEDCDDTNPDIHPDGNEIQGNGYDDDCEGGDIGMSADFGCPEPPGLVYTFDLDYAGICDGPPGTPTSHVADFDQDNFLVPTPGNSLSPSLLEDCDDFNAVIYPGAEELLDGLDNNCNGFVDETYANADWVFADYQVTRQFTAFSDGLEIPGLLVQSQVANVGDQIGGDLQDVPVYHFMPSEGPPSIISYGQDVFIPYHAFGPDAAAYACENRTLIGQVQPYAFGEAVIDNNHALYPLPEGGGADRAVFFDPGPSVNYTAGATSLYVEFGDTTTGSCPELPRITANGTPVVPKRLRVIVNNDEVYDSDSALSVQAVNLPDPLDGGDHLCIEVTLDRSLLIPEDHSDNLYAQMYEFQTTSGLGWTNQYLHLEQEAIGPSWATVSYPSGTCNAPDVAGGALIGSSPLLGLIGGVVLAAGGGLIAMVFGNGLKVSGLVRAGLVVIAIGLGGTAGFLGGFVMADVAAPAEEPRGEIEFAQALEAFQAIPSCERPSGEQSLQINTTSIYNPSDLVVHLPNINPMPDRLIFNLQNPSGETMAVPANLHTDDRVFDLGAAAHKLSAGFFKSAGEYQLSISAGEKLVGVDLSVSLPQCLGSKIYTFSLLKEPTPQLSNTPSGDVIEPTSTFAPTSTPVPVNTQAPVLPAITSSPVHPTSTQAPVVATVTAPPRDVAGPKVGNVVVSPDTVYTSGNKPDSASVTATVNDPGGVAQVVIYYRNGKGSYSVWGAMSNNGGGNYSSSFGPFPTGGVYSIRIWAVDDNGNANCSPSDMDACPGGSLTVTIP